VYTEVYTTGMNTKFVGVKDFRQNMAAYAKKAQKGDTRFIVVSRNNPLFEISPFDEDVTLESFIHEIYEARSEVSAGKFHTHADVVAELKAK